MDSDKLCCSLLTRETTWAKQPAWTGAAAPMHTPMARRYDYDGRDSSPGLSFLMVLLAVVALCVAGVYLRASTLHEREIKMTAYEQTIGNWTAFRPTFARLSVNVTAYFGVAPVNTTDPGLDTNPPPPGVSVALAKSEEADPIFDEEGDAGGLPEYDALKFERGRRPPPWRTAARSPPPDEDASGDRSEKQSSADQDPSEQTTDVQNDADENGDGRRRKTRRLGLRNDRSRSNEQLMFMQQSGRRRSRVRADHMGLDAHDYTSIMPEKIPTHEIAVPRSMVAIATSAALITRESRGRHTLAEADTGVGGGEFTAASIQLPTSAAGRSANGVFTPETAGVRDLVEDEEGDEEGKEEEEEAATLPLGFIPDAPFGNATSVRFVFSVRLDPAPPSSSGSSKGSGTRKNGSSRNLLTRRTESDGGRVSSDTATDAGRGSVDLALPQAGITGHNDNNNAETPLKTGLTGGLSAGRSLGGGGGGGGCLRQRRPVGGEGAVAVASEATGGRKQDKTLPVVHLLETTWAPLTRIRVEHAPMPAPETKCMQVFGGVHNYKTKMCEVYERLSRICVQVEVDETSGEISLAPVPDGTAGGEGVENGEEGTSGNGGEADPDGSVKVARYGCDPRSAWSPWSYSVLPVEGRTVLDVVPPASISFVETLVTVRSNLDPFIHVEALTYEPVDGGGGSGGSGTGVGGGSGGAGEGDGAGAVAGGGGVAAGGDGDSGVSSNGGGFLTFGLSSQSCAAVGFTFLAVGVLLLVQPMFALRKWCRDNAGGGEGGSVGSRRSGGSGRRGSRRAVGKWRYGQVGTGWGDLSDVSDDEGFVETTACDDGELDQMDDDEWGSESEWENQDSGGLDHAMSPSTRPRKGSPPLLRRRMMEGSGEEESAFVSEAKANGTSLSTSPLRLSSRLTPEGSGAGSSSSNNNNNMMFGRGKEPTFV